MSSFLECGRGHCRVAIGRLLPVWISWSRKSIRPKSSKCWDTAFLYLSKRKSIFLFCYGSIWLRSRSPHRGVSFVPSDSVRDSGTGQIDAIIYEGLIAIFLSLVFTIWMGTNPCLTLTSEGAIRNSLCCSIHSISNSVSSGLLTLARHWTKLEESKLVHSAIDRYLSFQTLLSLVVCILWLEYVLVSVWHTYLLPYSITCPWDLSGNRLKVTRPSLRRISVPISSYPG